jgi:hypothetical protein
MRKHTLSMLARLWLATFICLAAAHGQIPAAPTSGGEPHFTLNGMTDQPFTVEVLDAHRTVGNTLLVRLALTNRGQAPLMVQYDFADAEKPAEIGKTSGVYAIDPNGEIKYTVLRNSQGTAICSRLEPPLQPGERRNLFTQLGAPPDTSPTVSIFFPHAGRIENVPIGLPAAGEALPNGASIGDPGAYPSPAAAPPATPETNADPHATKISPDFVADQLGNMPPAASRKGIGTIQDGNSVVPFTVHALRLERTPDGKARLELTLTNDSSGPMDITGQFTGGVGDLAGNAQQISGVYLVDPVTHARFEVARPNQVTALCSTIAQALAPGERRELEAEFTGVPATVKTVYVYFPHASPIADVPVSP